MQEPFAIKLIDLDKLGVPDFDDFVDFRDYLPKPRNALSDIQNLAIEISGKIPVKHKQLIESLVYSAVVRNLRWWEHH